MRAVDIMTTAVLTVEPNTPVAAAAELMSTHTVTSLPVLDADGRIIGIVSEADIIADRMPHDPRGHPRPQTSPQRDPAHHVGQVMREFVVCLGPNADTADLAAVMVDSNVRAIPNTDGARLLGIVSRRDRLKTLLRSDDEVRVDVEDCLRDHLDADTRPRVTVSGGVVTLTGRFTDDAQHHAIETVIRAIPGVLRVHLRRRRCG